MAQQQDPPLDQGDLDEQEGEAEQPAVSGRPDHALHLAARWVEEAQWAFHRTFNAPPLRPGERAWLVFDRLELSAAIFLNGEQIGSQANAFHPCRLEVTGRLRAGENAVVVQVEAGLFATADRPGQGYGMAPDSALTKRNWQRTVQSSFGWDWSPRLLNVGITGDAYVEIRSLARLDCLVALTETTPDLEQGVVTARVFVEGLSPGPVSGLLAITVQGQGEPLCCEQRVTVAPGMQRLEARIAVPQPALWWPAGHGEQPLYKVRAVLTVEGTVAGEAVRRVGFRRILVDQSPHPAGGRCFILNINNRPIFCKGANFVPADVIPARINRSRYEVLIDRALDANFNLLRVWGGGLYESDLFYDLCDERGILVWQEFIFACAQYPLHDATFLSSVRQEATYQVRRLANHASLAIWCGNNEIEWLAEERQWATGVAYPDYALYHLLLPRIVNEEDGTRFYQPSSPFSPDYGPANADQMGDQHPWSIGFADTDFRKYRRMACRFPNEGGILGPTALPTVLACLPAGTTPASSLSPRHASARALLAWEQHDNSVAYWGGDRPYPDTMLEEWLDLARRDMTVEEYVYWAGVLQGEGLSEYIRNFRRRMFDSASAIFWMYNDCWPATRSWTIVDYYGRRTPAFWHVRRMFRPLIVALVIEDDRVCIYGVNEGLGWQGELRYGLFALAGDDRRDTTQTVTLPGNQSALLAEFPRSAWRSRGELTYGAFAILSQDGREVARDRLFLPLYKDLALPKAFINVRRAGGHAIFESDVFAWQVCLDLTGEVPLPDNFFDVLPRIPTVLDWPAELGAPCVVRIGNN